MVLSPVDLNELLECLVKHASRLLIIPQLEIDEPHRIEDVGVCRVVESEEIFSKLQRLLVVDPSLVEIMLIFVVIPNQSKFPDLFEDSLFDSHYF